MGTQALLDLLSYKPQGLALQGQFSGSHVLGQRHWMLLLLLLKGHLQPALPGVNALTPSDAEADQLAPPFLLEEKQGALCGTQL